MHTRIDISSFGKYMQLFMHYKTFPYGTSGLHTGGEKGPYVCEINFHSKCLKDLLTFAEAESCTGMNTGGWKRDRGTERVVGWVGRGAGG